MKKPRNFEPGDDNRKMKTTFSGEWLMKEFNQETCDLNEKDQESMDFIHELENLIYAINTDTYSADEHDKKIVETALYLKLIEIVE